MQLYVDDYLLNAEHRGTKTETQTLFADQTGFKEEIGRIFREVDAKNQAKKKITRLRQLTLVSAYTAEFKQLQAKINQDNVALCTVFETGLKEKVKDRLIYVTQGLAILLQAWSVLRRGRLKQQSVRYCIE